MKAIKIVISVILISFGLLFMGELSVLNTDTFQNDFYSVDFYMNSSSRNVKTREMAKDLCNAGKKHKVDFFAVEQFWDKDYQNDVNIIGTKGAINSLKKKGIKPGYNKSVVFDDVRVKFTDINDVADLSKIKTFYLFGDKEDLNRLRAFKSDLVDKYGGGFPKREGRSSELLLNTSVAWGLIIFLMLLFSFYEAACIKKEYAVRCILGQNIKVLFIKSILTDACSTMIIYVSMSVILSRFSNVSFKYQWVLVFVMIYIILNSLISLNSISINFRRDLTVGKYNHGILYVNYGMKFFITVITIIVISINFINIKQGYNSYKQKEFFNYHGKFAYYKMSKDVENLENDRDIKVEEKGKSADEKLYEDFYGKFQSKAWLYSDMTGNYNIKYPFIFVNKNGFKYLCKANPDLKSIEKNVMEHNTSILFPENIKKGSRKYNEALEMNDGEFLSEDEYGKWNVKKYDKCNAVGIHDNGKGLETVWYKNPVILVSNAVYKKTKATGYDAYCNYDIMYNISESEWKQFVDKHKIDKHYISITNSRSAYLHDWNQKKHIMMLTAGLVIFMFLLELSLIFLVIKLEYYFNAIEMAIMKVHGYSFFERNGFLIKSTFFSCFLGLMITLIINHIFSIGGDFFIIAAMSGILFLFELLIIMIKGNFIEKKSVIAILKGEKL